MLESLISTIDKAYEAPRHRELLTALWEQERWFDTPHQREAAEICRHVLTEAGLEGVERVPYAADGQTRWQDWTTHLAWDCPAAGLRMGDEVLADRQTCPTSVVYWSGPLKQTTAPVIDGDRWDSIPPARVGGKFVLTSKPPREMKQRLLLARPAAVVSDYLANAPGADENTTKWCNTWGDGPGGWYFRRGDMALPGFCLSPAAGRRLRERLAADEDVPLTGFCDARLYAGKGQCVTGVVPGRDRGREVWLFGHACEQGAHDNCSGVSVYVLAAAMLEGLIHRGLLPRPRCGIRVITTEECLGMLSFATEHPDLLGRAIVGMNVDGVGVGAGADCPFTAHYGPLSLPTFGWAAAGQIARAVAERNMGVYHTSSRCEPPCSDDQIADPNCGVPTLWLGTNGNATGYHSSADTPAVCSADSLRCNLLLVAAWAYVMADLNDRHVRALLPGATAWLDDEMLGEPEGDAMRLRRWAAGRALRDLSRWGVSESVYEPAASKYAPADAGPLDDLPAAGPRYARQTWGTCTLETLDADRTEGLSRWNAWQNAALFWTDGQRGVPAVERLTRAEVGKVPEGAVAKLMDACVEAGLAGAR